jgi:hypothetical protein
VAGLTLLARRYCHLCDEMQVALAPVLAGRAVPLTIVDVDEHPELEAKYGELVPVLLAEGEELCHYFLDEARVRAYLGAIS